MSKSTAFATDLQSLTFNSSATAPAWLAASNLYLALHTADPGAAGTQSTSECAYTGYARVSIPRTVAKWSQASGVITNADAIAWGACTAGSATAAWLTIGTDASGTGQVLHRGPLSPPIPIIPGITPGIAAGALVVTIRSSTEE